MVLLQYLKNTGVGQDAPMHQHECLAMKVDKTLQMSEVSETVDHSLCLCSLSDKVLKA